MPVRRHTAAGFALTLTLALEVAVSASGCSTSAPSATGSKGYVVGDGSFISIPAADRKTAPELSGPLIDGGSASLAADKGKVVVLNVWASWCGPCRQEAANFVAAAKMLPAASFIGINTRDDDANALAFVKSQGIPYPSFADQDGSLVLDMQKVINMRSLPMTVVLDKRGRVAAAIYGETTAITLKDVVQPLERES